MPKDLRRKKEICIICKEKKIVWDIDYKMEKVRACSDCITDNHLTGWSKDGYN
jgi:hypothetical protein